MTHISEIPAGRLVKQAHAGVKLINDQYPEAAAILREAITRFDVLREIHQLAKQEAQPVIPEEKIVGWIFEDELPKIIHTTRCLFTQKLMLYACFLFLPLAPHNL